MSSGPTSTLGKYQIIREIARSNDIVYEAYDPVMSRRVALKELAIPGGATSQARNDRIKRFLREARAAGSLVHPNIVTIYEVGEDSGRHFLAMEYLTGRNLREELDTAGLVTAERAVFIATEVLEGLAFAHKHGVVHRDIKPDNIQLLEDGQVKVTDFGIARLTFEPNLTIDGQVFGTPSYMSPEQINGKEIDARSDLFSVGVVLYEMLTGRKPFQGDSVVSITYAIMNRDPEPPQQIDSGIWQVIRQALQKPAQLRYTTAQEMIDALRTAPSVSSIVKPGPPPPHPLAVVSQQAYIPSYGQQNLGQAPITTPYGTALPGSLPTPAPLPPPLPIPSSSVPKPPTLSPAEQLAMRRFFLFCLVVGLVIAIIVAGRAAIDNVVARSRDLSWQRPASPPRRLSQPPPQAVPNEQFFPPFPAPDGSASYVAAEQAAEDYITAAFQETRPHASAALLDEAEDRFVEAIGKAPSAEKIVIYNSASDKFDAIARDMAERADTRWYAVAIRAANKSRGFSQHDPERMARAETLLTELGFRRF